MEWPFKLIPVSDMETILGGLEHGRFDAAIGAITITPERAARVDFSHPAHRSGVAIALRKETGPIFALTSYATAVSELTPLILVTLIMLIFIGIAMWIVERRVQSAPQGSESSVVSLRDGLYWAIVTMTTVGYGDKTPKTTLGRGVAALWMLSSLVLVSLLSTTLVSRLTAERVGSQDLVASIDLREKKLAAVAHSSGAEYLDELHLIRTYRQLWTRLSTATRMRWSIAWAHCSTTSRSGTLESLKCRKAFWRPLILRLPFRPIVRLKDQSTEP